MRVAASISPSLAASSLLFSPGNSQLVGVVFPTCGVAFANTCYVVLKGMQNGNFDSRDQV